MLEVKAVYLLQKGMNVMKGEQVLIFINAFAGQLAAADAAKNAITH